MVSRRGPRWMFWPAKLLWLPLVLVGAWLTFVTDFHLDPIGEGTFRVGMQLFDPTGWTTSPVVHGVGVVLLLAGFVVLRLYVASPDPDRRAVVEEFPLWTVAAYAFVVLAAGATWRLTGHVWETDANGLAWRFLAQMRVHWADRVLAVASLLAAIVCALLSYGRGVQHRYFASRSGRGA